MDYIRLLKSFKEETYDEFPEVGNYISPLQKGLWVLWTADEKFKFEEYLSAKQISEILRNIGISLSPVRINKAFARAGDKIDRKKEHNVILYKIMNKGKKFLKVEKGNISFIFIEGTKPRTDKRKFSEIIELMKGELLILDKFIGIESLNLLEKVGIKRNVKFLTTEIKDNTKKFSRELKDFRKEFKNIEIKKYPKPYELHDRYVISKDEILILGHGLKDLGSKESFVIKIDSKIGKNMVDSLREKFVERWSKSQNLK